MAASRASRPGRGICSISRPPARCSRDGSARAARPVTHVPRRLPDHPSLRCARQSGPTAAVPEGAFFPRAGRL